MINPNEGLKYLVWKIEAQQLVIQVKEKNPFLVMRNKEVYKFGKVEIFEIR